MYNRSKEKDRAQEFRKPPRKARLFYLAHTANQDVASGELTTQKIIKIAHEFEQIAQGKEQAPQASDKLFNVHHHGGGPTPKSSVLAHVHTPYTYMHVHHVASIAIAT